MRQAELTLVVAGGGLMSYEGEVAWRRLTTMRRQVGKWPDLRATVMSSFKAYH